jgi:predicted MFS family arabinose efflux permease
VAFSGALFMLVFALIRGNADGWTSAEILALLAGAAVALVAFVAVELAQRRPMFDLTLLRLPTFAGASIVAFVLSASMFAMFLYLTLYIQDVLDYSPLGAGLRFLPVSMLSFLVAPIAGKLSAYVPVRALLGGGLVLVGTGLALMSGVSASSHWTVLLPGFIVAGAGIGFVNPPLASTAIGVVPPQRSGMASGINSTFRQVGIATGIAALGAVFQSRVQDEISRLAAGSGLPHRAVSGLAAAVSSGGSRAAAARAPASQRAFIDHVARTGFVSGLHVILLVGAGVAFVGAALALALVRRRDFVHAGAPQVQPSAPPARPT